MLGIALLLCPLVSDHQRPHIRLNGVRRNAVRDGILDRIEWDDAGDARDRAECDDVRKESLADLAGGKRGDGNGNDVRRLRDAWDELAVNDQDARRGIEIARVLVRCRLCHGEDDVWMLDVRMIDRAVADDDLGAGRAAACLGAVGLRLCDIHPARDRRLGKDDGGGDDTLSARA